MASGQNQGLQVAVIIFVILTVGSMGFAVMTATGLREARTKADAEQKRAAEADQAALSLADELNFVKGLIGMKAGDTGELPDRAATEAFFQADLKKYGERLKAIEATATEPA